MPRGWSRTLPSTLSSIKPSTQTISTPVVYSDLSGQSQKLVKLLALLSEIYIAFVPKMKQFLGSNINNYKVLTKLKIFQLMTS